MVDGLRLPLNARVLDVGLRRRIGNCGLASPSADRSMQIDPGPSNDAGDTQTCCRGRTLRPECGPGRRRARASLSRRHFRISRRPRRSALAAEDRAAVARNEPGLQPGGYLIATVDTHWQLRQFFDPLKNPLLLGPRSLVGPFLRRRLVPPAAAFRAQVTRLREFKPGACGARLGIAERATPWASGHSRFSIGRSCLLPFGLRLNNRLQSMATAGHQFCVQAARSFWCWRRSQAPQTEGPCDFSQLDRRLQLSQEYSP